MEIKVIGTGCDKCSRLYENTLLAISRLGLDAQVQKVEALMEIIQLGVMSSPALMVDGKLLVSGQVASVDKIVALLKR